MLRYSSPSSLWKDTDDAGLFGVKMIDRAAPVRPKRDGGVAPDSVAPDDIAPDGVAPEGSAGTWNLITCCI